MKSKKKWILFIFSVLLFFLFVPFWVKESTKSQILEQRAITDNFFVDAILVLGAGVRGNSPSPMLEDRLLTAISLYKQGVSNKIIMSGDHGSKDYDEVNVMKNFAIKHGVASEDIFMDHAGFSSYDSIYRAKEIFLVQRVLIVTQKYHLYRALYIANALGIQAYGFSADLRVYAGQPKRDIREFLAREKDFLKVILKPQSTYVGETIPISGNGNLTND